MPKPWKMPPAIKIYEALGAIADGRVVMSDDRHASVRSSDGVKTYDVEISSDGREISSNDNGSYWQGYLGYPGIAMLLARGLYGPRPDVLHGLAGIPWKELNTQFHNDYERTLAEVMRIAEARGVSAELMTAEVDAVMAALRDFAPLRGARRRPPAARRGSSGNQ
jgi:hypothetical protein